MTLEQKLSKVFNSKGIKSTITLSHEVRIVDGESKMRICWCGEDHKGFYEGFDKIEDCLDDIISYLDGLPDSTPTEIGEEFELSF